jgi:plasmid stabilization system protein ParE
MLYKIIWSPNADSDFDAIIDYLADNCSNDLAYQFIQNFYKKLDLLEEMPFLGIKSQRFPTLRRLLITKHNSLIYRVIDDTIYLLNIIDNRQNPKTLKF